MPIPKGLSQGQKRKFVMDEWKKGNLHSGKGGPVVKNQKQAVAIMLSMTGKGKKG